MTVPATQFRYGETESLRVPKLNRVLDRATTRGMMLSISSLPGSDASEPLMRLLILGDWIIGEGSASAGIPPVAGAAFHFKKNGVVVGQVTFPLGATTGTMLFSDSALAAGSLFELYPPSPGDADLDQVSISVSLARI